MYLKYLHFPSKFFLMQIFKSLLPCCTLLYPSPLPPPHHENTRGAALQAYDRFDKCQLKLFHNLLQKHFNGLECTIDFCLQIPVGIPILLLLLQAVQVPRIMYRLLLQMKMVGLICHFSLHLCRDSFVWLQKPFSFAASGSLHIEIQL